MPVIVKDRPTAASSTSFVEMVSLFLEALRAHTRFSLKGELAKWPVTQRDGVRLDASFFE